jgi:hypothetical protein
MKSVYHHTYRHHLHHHEPSHFLHHSLELTKRHYYIFYQEYTNYIISHSMYVRRIYLQPNLSLTTSVPN